MKTREEIPAEYNNAKYAMGRLKSWTDYTLRQRRETLDRLISEMIQVGVNTKKFFEILKGMEGEKNGQMQEMWKTADE